MKMNPKKITMALAFAAIFFAWMAAGPSDVLPEEGGTLAKQIQGCWSLVSIHNERDGKRIEVFGANPRGSMILTPDGRFSIILMNAALPEFVSNNRTKGTAEEYQAVGRGSIAYFGTYTVASEKEHIVNLRIEGSTFPNWDGQEQPRTMIVTGNEMKFANSTPAIGGGTNHIVWKRVK